MTGRNKKGEPTFTEKQVEKNDLYVGWYSGIDFDDDDYENGLETFS
jgi:hypothetical protein